jgi:hypothetical protein
LSSRTNFGQSALQDFESGGLAEFNAPLIIKIASLVQILRSKLQFAHSLAALPRRYFWLGEPQNVFGE